MLVLSNGSEEIGVVLVLVGVHYNLLVLLVLCNGSEEVGVVPALLLPHGALGAVGDHHWDTWELRGERSSTA
jgi:hypothetical protein